MTINEADPAVVRWTRRLEETEALDDAVAAIRPKIREVFGTGTRGAALRGDWLGHALHPTLTDLPLGTWASAVLLDLFGGPDSRAAAQRLVGVGVVAAVPSAWSGWAQWVESSERDQRVGLVHAVTMGATIITFAASYVARRRGRHGGGARLALAGATVASVGGYLGGHLASARHVATRDPAYD